MTSYSVAGDGSWAQQTTPDNVIYKEFFATSGWQKGLTTLTEIWSGSFKKTWTTIAWTQDDTGLTYSKNARPYDISVYDDGGNRRRTEITYSSFNLPNPTAFRTEVKEYAADATTVLRRTTTTYIDTQPYIDRRVLGLLREVIIYDGNNVAQSKIWYDYDWSNDDYWVATPQPATQHDATGAAAGRGNLCWIGRWDISDIANFQKVSQSYIKYNRTGSVTKVEDHYGQGPTISYTDSFSDGRLTSVSGAGYQGVSSYVNNITYRAFGLKQVSYNNGRTLSVQYNNRLMPTQWNVSGVMGWNYAYQYFGENTGRVMYAQNINDGTLDRSYDYDHVGRLLASHSGADARAHMGIGPGGTSDGPYAQRYYYDQWGNITEREGWGGDNPWFTASYLNNKRVGLSYDAAGNLTSDGGQNFTYDATGQAATASYPGYLLQQYYDGDGLRVKKSENATPTYYLRSSVLVDRLWPRLMEAAYGSEAMYTLAANC